LSEQPQPVNNTGAKNASSTLYPFMPHLLKQRYRVLNRIGSGGYGQVFRAIDTKFMQRQVAIKEMIQLGLSPDELAEATEGFKREATLLASLTHPNLPSIYDFFDVNGNWYVVMSFIEGLTLDTYTIQKGGRLPVEKVLQISIQMAGVLSYLHTRRPAIIFRDLKPSNVMRTPEGQLYLIDFGIARHFKQGQLKDTMILGSPGYAAPEQYGRRQTTPQADIYSLGAVMHELISGKNATQSPFSQQPLDLPLYPQLSTLIQCMLELDVKKRPSSMLNIQHELQRIASGRAHPITNVHAAVSAQSSAQPASGSPPPLQTPPAPDVVAADSALPAPNVLAPAASVLSRLVQSLTAGALPAVRPVRKEQGGPNNANNANNAGANMLANGLDSLRAAGSYLGSIATRKQRVVADPRQSSDAVIFPGPAVAWSPDSRYLAVVTTQGTVIVYNCENAAWQVVCHYKDHKSMVSALAWSADSTLIATAALNGSVHIWYSSSGERVRTFQSTDTRAVLALAWSPDGALIALGDMAGAVTIYDAYSLIVHSQLVSVRAPILALTWTPDSQTIVAGRENGSATCWQLTATGSDERFYLRGHTGRITALTCSPDGRTLASASWDTTVRLWSMADGNCSALHSGHTDRVTALAWSSDSERIASASLDRTIRIWQTTTGHDILRYDRHNRSILGVAWSCDDRLASLDTQNQLHIWLPNGFTLHERFLR